MRRGIRIAIQDPEALSSAYEAGASGLSLAAELGVSRHTIYRRLRAQGVALRPSGREPLKLDVQDILARHAEGWSLFAIARRHGCRRSSVMRVLEASEAQAPRLASML